MRAFFLIAFLAIGAYGKHASQPRAFEDIIIDTIECVREEMKVGFPDFGIGSFDPLEIVDHTFVFDEWGVDGITGELNVQDLTFGGLMDFTISDLSGTIGLIPPSYTVKVKLTFPQPALDTKYVNDMNLPDGSNTFGDGTLHFIANNFVADVDLKATILGGIALEHFSILVSMDPLSEFVITGVRNDEEYSQQVSETILANGVAIIDENAAAINEVASEAIMNVVNGEGGEEGGFLSDLLDKCLGG